MSSARYVLTRLAPTANYFESVSKWRSALELRAQLLRNSIRAKRASCSSNSTRQTSRSPSIAFNLTRPSDTSSSERNFKRNESREILIDESNRREHLHKRSRRQAANQPASRANGRQDTTIARSLVSDDCSRTQCNVQQQSTKKTSSSEQTNILFLVGQS